MFKLYLLTFLMILSSCSSTQHINKPIRNPDVYEYAKFAAFHEGLFNFTYILKEMDEDLKKKYIDEYINGYKLYWSLARDLSFISVDMSIAYNKKNTEPLDPFYKRILLLHAEMNHQIQLHQIDLINDEIAVESFRYGMRVSRQDGFLEMFKQYFLDYCINSRSEKEATCQSSYAFFLEDYEKKQLNQKSSSESTEI